MGDVSRQMGRPEEAKRYYFDSLAVFGKIQSDERLVLCWDSGRWSPSAGIWKARRVTRRKVLRCSSARATSRKGVRPFLNSLASDVNWLNSTAPRTMLGKLFGWRTPREICQEKQVALKSSVKSGPRRTIRMPRVVTGRTPVRSSKSYRTPAGEPTSSSPQRTPKGVRVVALRKLAGAAGSHCAGHSLLDRRGSLFRRRINLKYGN